MQFGNPERLYALWALLPLAGLMWWLTRWRERRLMRLVASEVWAALVPGRNPRRTRAKQALWLGAAGLLLVALTQPQWGFHWEEVRQRGLNLLVMLDTSRSMAAQDIKPNRLQQAQWGVRDLVQKLRGDRIGLMAFAGSSYLACPLTTDYAAFLMMLGDVHVGLIPRGGTAIAQALTTALNSFEPGGQADRVIVLITDGEDHEGDPLALLPKLKEQNIRVYTVGVGTLEGELLPDEQAGHAGFFKDRAGNVVKSVLHEDVLRKLAAETGGAYVRAVPGDFGLDRLYEQGMAPLKRDEQASRMAQIYEDRSSWFLGAALALLALEAALRPGDRRREVPA